MTPALTGVVNLSSVVIAGSLNATGLTLTCPSVTVAGDFITNNVGGQSGGSVTDPSFTTVSASHMTTVDIAASTVWLGGGASVTTSAGGGTLAFVAASNVGKCAWYTAGNEAPTLQLDAYGNLTASGTVLATSDGNVKNNVRVIDGALERVLALRGVTFDRIDAVAETSRRHMGFIAQHVADVMPEAVYVDANTGRQSVAYGNMVALLVEAIHDLVSEVRGLSSEDPSDRTTLNERRLLTVHDCNDEEQSRHQSWRSGQARPPGQA